MTNEEIIQRGQLINDETEPAQNTSERVGGVIKGIGQNLADKDTAIAAEAARNGYYQCTVSGTTLAVTAPGFTLPAHGGNIRIKMSAPATGACTLNINDTDPKALLYNGNALSSANTWEQNEIISVFYDPSGSGQYLASNSQGGGGKAEKIKYDNSQSGLAADNVQGATDIVNDKINAEYNWEDVKNASYLSNFGVCITESGVSKFTHVTTSDKAKYTHRVVKVPANASLFRIKANDNYVGIIYFVPNYVVPTANNEEITLCEGFTDRTYVKVGMTGEYNIPDDCNYIIVNGLINNTNYFPTSMSFGYVEKPIVELGNVVFKKFFEFSQREWVANKNGIILDNVYLVDSSNRIHKVVERDSRAVCIKVTATSSTPCQVALLKSYSQPPTGRTLADLCADEAGTHIVAAGETSIFAIPDDCNFVLFNQFDGTYTSLPAHLEWGYDDTAKQGFAEWLLNGRKVFEKSALGIIGDSISTYNGYIAYNTQYGISTTSSGMLFLGVTSVEQTWWKMFANAMGFGRVQNLSSAGSGVITRSSAMPGLYERTLLLDDDCSMVIISLGTNDSGQSQPLGDYDWDSDIDSLSESEFIPALTKSVRRIKERLPNAKILLFYDTVNEDYITAENTIAEHYGCYYLNMRDFYTAFGSFNNPSDIHPSVNQMGFIYNGLMEYVRNIDFDYPFVENGTGLEELSFTTAHGSIALADGSVASSSDTNRLCTDYIDVGDADELLIRRGHLSIRYIPACYDYDKNFLGCCVSNGDSYKLCPGTRYIRRSLTTSGQVVTNDFKIFAIKKDKGSVDVDKDCVEVRLSDCMNPLQTDQQNIEDCLSFVSGFSKKVIHFDVERLVVSKAILVDGNTTIVLENCTIKQADGTFDNVFRSSNLNPEGNGGQDMTLDIPVLENIKIIGDGKSSIIGPDVNAVDGNNNPMVGDGYGFRTWQICMTRVHGVEISNIGFTKTRCWCVTFELCENVSVHDVAIHSTCKNGDGIDFRTGCKHCEVYNVQGYTTDDLVACTDLATPTASITALYNSSPTWKLWASLYENDVSSLDIEDVNVRDCVFAHDTSYSTGGHGMICLAAYGRKVHHVSVNNFREYPYLSANNKTEGLIKIYHGYGSGYNAGDLNTINLNNVKAIASNVALMVKGGIVENVRANKLVNTASGGSIVSVSDGNVIGTNVIVTNS